MISPLVTLSTLWGFMHTSGGFIPPNALLNDDGSPLVNDDGTYLLNEE